MSLFNKIINLKFILLAFTMLLSFSCQALSPELLERLKKENIVDTTQTLSQQELLLLKKQNLQIEEDNHVSIIILILNKIDENHLTMSNAIFNQINSFKPNVEDTVLILIKNKGTYYESSLILSNHNKNITNKNYEYSSGYSYQSNKLSSIEYMILDPLIKENKFYAALQASQTYIQQVALKQEPTYDKFYFDKKNHDENLKIYYIYYAFGSMIFIFFMIGLCQSFIAGNKYFSKLIEQANHERNLNLQSDGTKKIYIFSIIYLVSHIMLSISLVHYYFEIDFLHAFIINMIILASYLAIIFFSSQQTLEQIFSFKRVFFISLTIFAFTILFVILPANALGLFLVFLSFMIVASYFYNMFIAKILKYFFDNIPSGFDSIY